MDIKTERALAALEHAFKLIREAYEPHTSADAEARRVASQLARARGYTRPDAIVAFAPDGPAVTIMVDSTGAAALSLLAEDATLVPAWKLFEADARTAIAAVRPPAPSRQDAQARAIGDAFGMAQRSPDMRRQHAED